MKLNRKYYRRNLAKSVVGDVAVKPGTCKCSKLAATQPGQNSGSCGDETCQWHIQEKQETQKECGKDCLVGIGSRKQLIR